MAEYEFNILVIPSPNHNKLYATDPIMKYNAIRSLPVNELNVESSPSIPNIRFIKTRPTLKNEPAMNANTAYPCSARV